MELISHSPRSSRKQCKLTDYVTTTTAAVLEGGDSKEQQKSSKPVTPKNQKVTPITPKPNPIMTRIQRDLNSPSANLRMRALKAIRSPTKSAYNQFDISYSEKSIITAEERAVAAKTPPSLRDILKDIVVYVEVRTADDDRSAGVKKVIEALGARVNDTLRRDTTHVIFKDGRQSTFKKAKSLNIPIVSILWIEECKNQRRICDPSDFPISNLDRYENPELYGKMKRYKFIQPGAEDKKRRAKKTIATTPDKPNFSQTDIGRFFKTLDKTSTPGSTVKTPLRSNKVVESPATALLNRITSNTYTPLATINKCKSGINNLIETTPLNSRRKSIDTKIANTTNSIAQLSISQLTPKSSLNNDSQSARKTNTQRRRTMMPNANSTRISEMNQTQKETPQNKIVVTEEIIVNDKKSTTSFTVRSTVRRRTSISCQSMDISEMANTTPLNSENQMQNQAQKTAQRRRTLFTPQTVLESTNEVEKKSTTTSNKIINEPSTDATIVELESMAITPTMPTAEHLNEAAAPISASRHLCRRRTLFDISMDIISHQVQNINTKSRQSMLLQHNATPPPTTSKNAIETENTNECNTPIEEDMSMVKNNVKEQTSETLAATSTTTTVETKKRKLFRPIESSPYTPPPATPSKIQQTQSARKSINAANLPASKAALKRRRTLMPVQSSDSIVNSVIVDSTPVQQSIPTFKPQTLPNKKNLHERRSTLDFNETVERIKSKSNSVTSLKENNLNNSNSNQIISNRPIIAKRRLPFLAFTNMRSEQIAVIEEINRLMSDLDMQQLQNLRFLPPEESSTLYFTLLKASEMKDGFRIVLQSITLLMTVAEAVKQLGGFTLERTVSSHSTHMVSLEPRRTMNLLRGLVRGLWILEYNWILHSMQAGHWLNEEQYELKDFSRAVEICRAERQAFGNNYKCELFADLGAFFISSRCDNIPTRDLKELIRLCGGKVVEQRQNAKYILSSSTRAVDDKIYVTPLWILDSITQMQLLRIQKYSASSQLPTKHTPSNTRNKPTAIDLKD